MEYSVLKGAEDALNLSKSPRISSSHEVITEQDEEKETEDAADIAELVFLAEAASHPCPAANAELKSASLAPWGEMAEEEVVEGEV